MYIAMYSSDMTNQSFLKTNSIAIHIATIHN